jgi:hypothetical protein
VLRSRVIEFLYPFEPGLLRITAKDGGGDEHVKNLWRLVNALDRSVLSEVLSTELFHPSESEVVVSIVLDIRLEFVKFFLRILNQ